MVTANSLVEFYLCLHVFIILLIVLLHSRNIFQITVHKTSLSVIIWKFWNLWYTEIETNNIITFKNIQQNIQHMFIYYSISKAAFTHEM